MEMSHEAESGGAAALPPPTSGWKPLLHVRVAGLWVATASRQALVDAALHDARLPTDRRRARLVFDANGHGVSLAASDESFRNALESADVVHADGGFLVTFSRWLAGKSVAERSATTDMIHDFAGAQGGGFSFYLLGGTEEVNAKATAILQQMYPNLKIVGRRNGYFSREQESDVVKEINATKPDVLWVGLGKPFEQEFCIRNRKSFNAAWVITCGGCYNYITGDYSRAPNWMQRANLEWVHRAATRPKQLLWRYLTTTPHALFLALTNSTKQVELRGTL